ncbi:MAG: hypothetical protein JXQ96_11845 [Cyclobacteriaceae bacterium]
MTRILAVLVLVIGMVSMNSRCLAQEATAADTTRQDGFFNLYAGIYGLATQFSDPDVTRVALYHLLMISPNKSGILDSLALEYYNNQKWISVALVTKENLKINPENELALELSAISYENLGIKDQSLAQYELLFLKNDNTPTLYRVAFLQYELKRYTESLASIEILLKRSDISEQKMLFPKADKSQQEVTMNAALLNLKGLISKAQGNIEKAKEFYLEALNASPGFELAQLNLSQADK